MSLKVKGGSADSGERWLTLILMLWVGIQQETLNHLEMRLNQPSHQLHLH